jgi:Family of unknown function (DUF5305)
VYRFTAAEQFTVSGSTLLNLSTLSALESEIANETGVTTGSWSVEVVNTMSGAVTAGGESSFLGLTAPVWFNVSTGEIVPGEFNATQLGSVPSPDAGGGGSGSSSFVVLLSYGILAASAAGLVAAAIWMATGEDASPERELARLTSPYAEVIVGTHNRPRPSEVIRLSRWEDLVKVADTTGRPILRLDGAGESGTGRSFIVLDGAIGYLYVYTGPGGRLDAG